MLLNITNLLFMSNTIIGLCYNKIVWSKNHTIEYIPSAAIEGKVQLYSVVHLAYARIARQRCR